MIVNIIKDNLGEIESTTVKTLKELITIQLNQTTCLANFSSNKRNNESFTSIKWLQMDFDKVSVSPKELSDKISCNHYILNTKSNGINGTYSYHLFVPIKKEITNVSFYKHFIYQFCDHFNITNIDEKAKDAVRFFWKHKSIALVKMDEKSWEPNINDIARRIKQENKEKLQITKYNNSTNKDFIINYIKKHPEKNIDVKTDGNRWNSFLILKGACDVADVSLDNLVHFLDANSHYETNIKKQFTREKVLNFIKNY